MVVPVGGSGPGSQGILQLPVEPLHQPVRLWVVSCCRRVADVEQIEEGPPQCRRELMMAGTPKQKIQLANRSLAKSGAVLEECRIASGHRDVLSITVNRYVWPR